MAGQHNRSDEPNNIQSNGELESKAANGVNNLPAKTSRNTNVFRRFFRLLGPGLIAGASDDDPTAIATYSAAGATFGYSTLWTALVTFPMMVAVQFASAKIGVVTGCGLARVMRDRFPRRILYPAVFALLIANTINAGASIGAIAAGINLLIPVPIVVLIVPITIIIIMLLIIATYRSIANTFKWLTLALFGYIGAAILAKPDATDLLRGTFIPTFSFDRLFLATLVAILGTNISPYLFFWQASEEVEDQRLKGIRRRRSISQPKLESKLNVAMWDTTIGMFFSNAVVYSVNVAAAATLFPAGAGGQQTASDAAMALRPLAGDAAGILFALALIGSGFLSVPILASSSAYAAADLFGWEKGLGLKLNQARLFYGVIILSMLVGMLMNFLGINPISALFWAAVINGLLAPPLLVLVMIVVNDRRIMGDQANGPLANWAGWITTLAMFLAAVGLILTW